MKNLKFVFFLLAILTMVLAIVVRIFFPEKVFLGLHSLTYLRLTITMLLFTIASHFLFNKE